MKMINAVIVLYLVVLAIIVSPFSVFANTAKQPICMHYIDIEPFWVNTARITVNFSITNGRAVLSGTVIGNVGTESITVDAVLERENPDGSFTHIVTFAGLHANGVIWAWERPHMVARGHYYRLTLTAIVVRNGISEEVSLSRTTWAS